MPTPQEALDYAKRFVGNMPVDDDLLKYRVLDGAHKKLWMRALWRWTVGTIEPVLLVNDQQDYNLSAISDFLHLVQAKLGTEPRDLVITSTLPSTSLVKGRPTQVAFVSGSPQKLRLFPVPTAYTGTLPSILSLYKKSAPTIAAGNIGTDYSTIVSGFPAEYFWVFEEMVLLKAFQFSNNPKAGSVTTQEGRVQYTGQWGVVEAAIQEMITTEKKIFDATGNVLIQGVNNG